jgi:hypothetical protein
MLHKPLAAAVMGAAVLTSALCDPAGAGSWRYRPAAPAVLTPGWGYYSFPWGYSIPTAPYSHPAIMNCLQRRPVPRPWGVGWREYWAC